MEKMTQDDQSEVSFMTYNMTGADAYKCKFVRDICSEFDIQFCCLQEHFKTAKNTEQWFKMEFRDSHSKITPAHRSPGTDSGRGKGGLVQLITKKIKVKKKKLICKSFRLQAQIISVNNLQLLWINCYFPCDSQNRQHGTD